MASNDDFAMPPPGRFVVVLEPVLLDLIDGLGFGLDVFDEVAGLVATIPPEQRIAYVLGLYDEFKAHEDEPEDLDL
nr:hypothetical protein [Candidatus Sigynarchaeum springense]